LGTRPLHKVPHRKRPTLCARHPVHVTWRVLPHVWNLRSRRCFSRISECFLQGRDRFGFRLVHFSVQGNHVHLMVEAHDERALAYVLMNFLHHFPDEAPAYARDRRDQYSSAWRERGRDPPVVPARTWLLSVGWRTRASGGLLLIAAAC
jgi:hypothetical protein